MCDQRRTTRLYIVGAGPVGQRVARLAVDLDFQVTVIDERSDWVKAKNFPDSVQLLGGALETILPPLPLGPDDFVAIVMQVWQRDARALELLVPRPLAYLGMIGCRRKLDEIFPSLLRAGVSEPMLAKVKAPIGLKIGSRTPAEIAISICAELVAIRSDCEKPPSGPTVGR